MIRPFLKWAGGKTRALPQLLSYLPQSGNWLIEPFVGSASVFLATNYRRYILADINPDLINLYCCAVNHPNDLISLSRSLFGRFADAAGYLCIRTEFNNQCTPISGRHFGKSSYSLHRAARFLYLNRHGFNGLCRYNQKGKFNVPFGQHKKIYFPEQEIRFFAEKANDTQAIFLCARFQATLSLAAAPTLPDNSTVYCDPPYLPSQSVNSFTQYYDGSFTEFDHRLLSRSLLHIACRNNIRAVVSGSDTPETREIYKYFYLREINVRRSISASANRRQPARELIGVLAAHGCPPGGCGGCPDARECLGYSGIADEDNCEDF